MSHTFVTYVAHSENLAHYNNTSNFLHHQKRLLQLRWPLSNSQVRSYKYKKEGSNFVVSAERSIFVIGYK